MPPVNGVSKMPMEVVEYCSECGKPLLNGEVYYHSGLHYCVYCKDIVGARLGV